MDDYARRKYCLTLFFFFFLKYLILILSSQLCCLCVFLFKQSRNFVIPVWRMEILLSIIKMPRLNDLFIMIIMRNKCTFFPLASKCMSIVISKLLTSSIKRQQKRRCAPITRLMTGWKRYLFTVGFVLILIRSKSL